VLWIGKGVTTSYVINLAPMTWLTCDSPGELIPNRQPLNAINGSRCPRICEI